MITWTGTGMFAIANMNPESRNAGRNVETIAIWLASNCPRATVLMRMPCASVPTMNSAAMPKSSGTLPRNGTSKTHTAIATAISDVDHADDEVRHQLAQDQLRRPHRRGDELLHRAALPLPRDRQRGEQGRDHPHDHRDQPGDDEVLRFEIGVEPHPRTHLERRPYLPTAPALRLRKGHLLIKSGRHSARVTQHDRRGIRIGAVDNGLHGGHPSRAQFPGKINIDDQGEHCLAVVNRPLDIAIVVDRCPPAKSTARR